MRIQEKLSQLPQVNECLNSSYGKEWLESYCRAIVVRSIREVIDTKRKEILDGSSPDVSLPALAGVMERTIRNYSAYKLRPLINASGVIVHTNLGRAVLSERALANVAAIAGSYSNLEYELARGKRGKRYAHIKDIIRELTGAEDALVVNNNAAAVLIVLDTLARGKEVIVSRGELVEIGGSFRIPEVMQASGAVLRDVGTTNKTHISDYENALCGNTGLFLKVHQSNYKVIGFTDEVPLASLVRLGKAFRVPVVDDLGSGSLINLEQYGIQGEPTVQDVIREGVDLVTFSGDKLLGGPQAGIIAGRKKFVQPIEKNPMLRAMRIDKMTFAALEATLMQYLDEHRALSEIPVLQMLTCSSSDLKKKASRIVNQLRKVLKGKAELSIIPDQSRAGGGSLPETDFPTFAVSLRPLTLSVNELERKLRQGDPPVIARIQEKVLLIDVRTVLDKQVKTLMGCVIAAFEQ